MTPQAVALVLAIADYTAMAALAAMFFRTTSVGARAGKRFISVIGSVATVGTVWLPWKSAPTSLAAWISSAMYATSLGLMACAYAAGRRHHLEFAFATSAPDSLIRSGPYRFIRHPFYTSYILGWLAAVVFTWTWISGAVLTVMFLFYWKAATKEEHLILLSPLGKDYAEYRRITGMFLPSLRNESWETQGSSRRGKPSGP